MLRHIAKSVLILCPLTLPAGAQSLLSPAPMSGGGQTLQSPAPQTPAAQSPGAPAAQPAARRAAPKKKAAAPHGGETVLDSNPTPSLTPDTFYATAKASERYAAIADAGGWPRVPSALRPGARGKAVAVLRQRLAIEGDLPQEAGQGESWDEQLTQAVKRFQSRAGLKQTGIVAGKTLAAMNVPAAVRFRQLASSAQRIAGLKFDFGPRYVVVNIPSLAVEAVKNGRVARRYVAIVGNKDRQSPEVVTRITTINLNPTWTVPPTVMKKDMIPRLQRDPGYLARARIRVLDRNGGELDARSINWSSPNAVNYTLRQDPGANNALGNIRINMPNNQAVYMHDTPSKRGFSADDRFLSSGCIRVQDVFAFAEWILQDTPGGWSKASMLKRVASQKRHDIRVNQAIPVAWVYMTAWANRDGSVNYRDDVYNRDRVGGARAAALSR